MNSPIKVPWSAWREDGTFEFPESAELNWEMLRPANAVAWDRHQIEESIFHPIGMAPVRALAADCRTACIAVDDLSRPTPAGDVLPIVLGELEVAGIKPQDCVIVVATGTHRVLTDQELEKKIGRSVLDSGVRVEVHDCSDELAPTGIQYGNEELRINRSFFEAEFKLGISSVLPHSFAGFSGGAKMMLPGLANVEATARSHKFVQMGLRGGSDLSKNRFRSEIESLAKSLGFEFTICVLTNQDREIAGVFAGDIVEAHRTACDVAAQTYRTECHGTFDAMVVNAYPKDTDLIQADNATIAFKQTGFGPVRESGVVVISTAADEFGTHGLFAPGGVSHKAPVRNRALRDRDLWIFAPNLNESDVRKRYWDGYPHFREPEALVNAMIEKFGAGARVGVLPCGPMQQLAIVE